MRCDTYERTSSERTLTAVRTRGLRVEHACPVPGRGGPPLGIAARVGALEALVRLQIAHCLIAQFLYDGGLMPGDHARAIVEGIGREFDDSVLSLVEGNVGGSESFRPTHNYRRVTLCPEPPQARNIGSPPRHSKWEKGRPGWCRVLQLRSSLGAFCPLGLLGYSPPFQHLTSV